MQYKRIITSQQGKINILEDVKQKLVLKVESLEKEIERLISKNNEDNDIEIDNPSEEEQQSDSDSSWIMYNNKLL